MRRLLIQLNGSNIFPLWLTASMLFNMKYNTIDENSNPDESLDIITITLQPDETSSSIETFDDSNKINKNIVNII